MFITQQHAQSIVDEMKSAIHRDINIMDNSGMIIASTNIARQGQRHQGATQMIQNQLSSLIIWEDDIALGVQRGINLPIIMCEKLVGVIGISGDPLEVSIFGDVIKRMTEIMVDHSHRQEQSDLMEHAKNLFIENWLFSDQPDWSELEIRGKLLGVDINMPYTVALLQFADQRAGDVSRTEDSHEMRSSRILRLIQTHLKGNINHYCIVLRSRIIILLHHTSRTDTFSIISRICQDIEGYYAIPMRGGVSNLSRDAIDIRRCYLEAQTANAVAIHASNGQVFFYDQVSLELIVQSIPRSIKQNIYQLVFSKCTKEEQLEFIQYIALYFQEDGDIKRCADTLFVHRNTVQYHMDQLKKKTGFDLRKPKDALLLYMTTNGSDVPM